MSLSNQEAKTLQSDRELASHATDNANAQTEAAEHREHYRTAALEHRDRTVEASGIAEMCTTLSMLEFRWDSEYRKDFTTALGKLLRGHDDSYLLRNVRKVTLLDDEHPGPRVPALVLPLGVIANSKTSMLRTSGPPLDLLAAKNSLHWNTGDALLPGETSPSPDINPDTRTRGMDGSAFCFDQPRELLVISAPLLPALPGPQLATLIAAGKYGKRCKCPFPDFVTEEGPPMPPSAATCELHIALTAQYQALASQRPLKRRLPSGLTAPGSAVSPDDASRTAERLDALKHRSATPDSTPAASALDRRRDNYRTMWMDLPSLTTQRFTCVQPEDLATADEWYSPIHCRKENPSESHWRGRVWRVLEIMLPESLFLGARTGDVAAVYRALLLHEEVHADLVLSLRNGILLLGAYSPAGILAGLRHLADQLHLLGHPIPDEELKVFARRAIPASVWGANLTAADHDVNCSWDQWRWRFRSAVNPILITRRLCGLQIKGTCPDEAGCLRRHRRAFKPRSCAMIRRRGIPSTPKRDAAWQHALSYQVRQHSIAQSVVTVGDAAVLLDESSSLSF